MRLAWGLASVVALFGVARLLGQEAPITILMVLIAFAGILYWLLLWPLTKVVEHRTPTQPKPVNWSEAWRVIRENPLVIRALGADALAFFGMSIFGIFQLYFLTISLAWSDGAALDLVWVLMLGMALSSIFWGAVADRLGDRAVAQLGFLGMIICTLCWVSVGNNTLVAKCIVLGATFGLGIFRAGAFMSTTRVILNHIPERVSPMLLTVRSVCITLAVTGAGVLGSMTLTWMGDWKTTTSGDWLLLDAYKVLFLISAAAR